MAHTCFPPLSTTFPPLSTTSLAFFMLASLFSVTDSFDHFVLALTWTPTFCQFNLRARCIIPPVEDGFVLHGLWPSERGPFQPEYCEGHGINAQLFRWNHGREVSGDLLARMTLHWPAFTMPNPSFWNHQWVKHGTCSDWSRSRYIGEAIGLFRVVNLFELLGQHGIFPIDENVTPHKTYNRTDIKRAVGNAYYPILGGAEAMNIEVDCKFGHLVRVRICLTPGDFAEFIDCPNSGNCPTNFRFLTYSNAQPPSQQPSPSNPNQPKVPQAVKNPQKKSNIKPLQPNTKPARLVKNTHTKYSNKARRLVTVISIFLMLCIATFQQDAIVSEVKLHGYSVEENLRVLAYEFASMRSLGDILHGREGVQGAQPEPTLNWMQRVRIAVDAARGLEYLHEKVQPAIIHGDIRLSNVLIFEDYRAKIAGFNLSNQAPDMAARLHSTRVLGTFGYHAPEYFMTGQLTQKTDVYSFGVVLLELLTGGKPVDHTMPQGQHSLFTWATGRLRKDKVKSWVDPNLKGAYPLTEVVKLADLAKLCVHDEADLRPKMSFIVNALQNLVKAPAPAPQTFAQRIIEPLHNIRFAFGMLGGSSSDISR